MSDTGKQSPLGVNVLSGFLQNTGLRINAAAARYMGTWSGTAFTYGTLISNTVLTKLEDAINLAYTNGMPTSDPTTFTNLVSIGNGSIPALGDSKPSTYTGAYTATDMQYGFTWLMAVQAYNEFKPTYADMIGDIQTASSFITISNKAIMTMQNSLTFLDGTYSNMNDLISADLTGVTLATTVFGQDLIYSGKVLNLSKMDSFGLPSNLLQTLKRYNALTPSLTLALLASGLSSRDIEQLTSNTDTTISQQQKAYAAFLVIKGIDLEAILVPLNCKTAGLESLADLLDIRKLFPNSYQSLTVPVYNITPGPTNSKTYYPIFQGTGVNSTLTNPEIVARIGIQIPPGTPTNDQTNGTTGTIQNLAEGFGSYLVGILPNDIAVTAGAFSTTMMQIRNIVNVPIEKFAQVVTCIETTRGLDVNGTNIPVDAAQAKASLALVAFGSGPFGTYTYSDFFGCITGLPYNWMRLQELISVLQTNALVKIYSDIYDAVDGNDIPTLDSLIIDANVEITKIKNTGNPNVAILNTLWNTMGTQFTNEKSARSAVIQAGASFPYPLMQYGFVDSIPGFAIDTAPNMGAQTLEALCDLSNITGQSLDAMLRASRNQARLSTVGIPLDDNISDQIPLELQTELIANDTTSFLMQVNPAGDIIIPEPLGTYIDGTYFIGATPAATGEPVAPGSLAGSPYAELLVPSLDTIYTSDILLPATYSVKNAIEQVIRCNCDCWIQ